jgi:hypothetical protein
MRTRVIKIYFLKGCLWICPVAFIVFSLVLYYIFTGCGEEIISGEEDIEI